MEKPATRPLPGTLRSYGESAAAMWTLSKQVIHSRLHILKTGKTLKYLIAFRALKASVSGLFRCVFFAVAIANAFR